MCGATDQQKSIADKQEAFYGVLTAHYQEAFGKQSAILEGLTKIFKPIFDKGPDQEGFGAAEKTALETNATEGVAKNFGKAAQFLHGQQAARGGSDFIPSGQDAMIDETLAATAMSERSSVQNQIIQANYDTGRKLWLTAGQGLMGVASAYDPNGAAGVANQGGVAAADTANQIAQADNSIWGAVIGGLSGIAGAAVGGYTQGLGKAAGSKPA
jgi:hypothetical protein